MTWRERAPEPVKRAGRRLSRGVGLLTADARLLPTFLVVGAQRAGTTSLHRALLAHPQVVGPVLHKGVHYFDVSYTRGLRWYRAHFPLARVATGRAGGPPAVFESAGYYLHHPYAPARIAETLPGVRVVAMLRDPVERAYSAHRHEVARGFETLGFEQALEREPERLEGEVERLRDPGYVSVAHRHHSYVDRGRYAEQVERLWAAFGRDRVHLVWSEDFFERPEPVFAALCDFLGLSSFTPPTFERWNARPRAPMADATRARLDAVYEPLDAALAELTGEVPSWRR